MARLLTVKEVARAAGIHEETVYRALRCGALHGIKMDGAWRMDISQVYVAKYRIKGRRGSKVTIVGRRRCRSPMD